MPFVPASPVSGPYAQRAIRTVNVLLPACCACWILRNAPKQHCDAYPAKAKTRPALRIHIAPIKRVPTEYFDACQAAPPILTARLPPDVTTVFAFPNRVYLPVVQVRRVFTEPANKISTQTDGVRATCPRGVSHLPQRSEPLAPEVRATCPTGLDGCGTVWKRVRRHWGSRLAGGTIEMFIGYRLWLAGHDHEVFDHSWQLKSKAVDHNHFCCNHFERCVGGNVYV